jgi:splicing factor 3A subunit 1
VSDSVNLVFVQVKDKVKQRVDWARYQERERKKEEDERERERGT